MVVVRTTNPLARERESSRHSNGGPPHGAFTWKRSRKAELEASDAPHNPK